MGAGKAEGALRALVKPGFQEGKCYLAQKTQVLPYFFIGLHWRRPWYSLGQGILATHSFNKHSRPPHWVRSWKYKSKIHSSLP